jgi:hypothetical protein
VEKLAADLVGEMKKFRAQNRFPGHPTFVVYSYAAIVFREAVILADDKTLFSDAALIQLVPTAGGSFLARGLEHPVAAWLVSLASKSSAAENPFGSFAEKLWEGDGNAKFYEAIDSRRMHTILLEGDSHSLAGVKNAGVQRRYRNGLGPNVVVIPKSSGVTHECFPNHPVALAYLRTLLGLPRVAENSVTEHTLARWLDNGGSFPDFQL